MLNFRYMDIMRQKLGLSGLPSDCVDEMLITDLLMVEQRIKTF